MANTNVLKDAEQYVRGWCSAKYKVKFEDREKEIRLITGGFHRFDIVSKDGTIVAGVKTSALREDGKVGTGVIRSTFTELYFLSLVSTIKKLMILTDKGYYDHFRKISKGKVAAGIEIVYCLLTKEIAKGIFAVHKRCRNEIGKK